MENKYKSQKIECEKKYKMPIREILLEMKEKNMTCKQVALELDYKVSTIRTYCWKYKIILKSSPSKNNKKYVSVLEKIRSQELNTIKVISMQW